MSAFAANGTKLSRGPPSDESTQSNWLDYLLLVHDRQLAPIKPRLGYSSGSELYVGVSTQPNAGYGLFSNTIFVPGDAISLYDGIVIDKSEAGFASSREARTKTHTCSIRGSEYTIVGFRFALRGRGLGSFANHSTHNNAVLRVKRFKVRYHNHQNCPFLDSCVIVEACTYISAGRENVRDGDG